MPRRAVIERCCSKPSTSPTEPRAGAPSSSTAACDTWPKATSRLVREALHERGVLLRNAPHLVHRREFVVPAYHWLELPYYGIGLKLYDWMSGSLGLGRSRWIGPAEVIARMPAIRGEGLRGGIVYTDGQFDDARLAIALGQDVCRPGRHRAQLHDRSRVSRSAKGGSPRSWHATPRPARNCAIEARSVINAAGVYVDAVQATG